MEEGGWEFFFDEDTAELYCEFFGLLEHSKGRFAGQPFRLEPWQLFIVWQLFGWKRNSDGSRRFRRLFLTIGRKNGKSTFAAALEVLLGLFDGEQGSEVYVGATKLEQAKIIHDEAERMVRKSRWIHKHSIITKNNIAFPSSNSFCRPVGSDKPFDGLNPHGVIFDEMHAWREHHRGFYDTLTTGSAARSQPLRITISTKGDEKSLIFNEELDYSRRVVEGEVSDDAVLVLIYEMDKDDDLWDETCWPKANPNLGVSVSLTYLREQANESKNKTTGAKRFERYHGNRTITSVDSPVTADLWDKCTGQLTDWQDAVSIGAGVDLGGRDDLAAYAITCRYVHEVRRPEVKRGKCPSCGEKRDGDECSQCEETIYRLESRSRAFIAKDASRDLTEEPFRTWIETGQLVVCDYVVSELKRELIADCQEIGCRTVCFDPYQAAQLAEELEAEGLEPVKMPQNCSQFNEPIHDWISAMSEGRFVADKSDLILRWAALNMAIRQNAACQWMPDKRSSSEKIDPVVAMLMSQRAAGIATQYLSPTDLYLST